MHGERLVRGTHQRRLHRMPWPELPDGTFVSIDGAPLLVLGDELVEWMETGYAERCERPATGAATVITPPSSVAVLRAGYRVQLDATALGRAPTDP